MKEIYFSCDVEADGPIPGPHSMLSLGCAALIRDNGVADGGVIRGTFSANLLVLPDAAPDKDTWDWWQKTETNRAAYAETRKNCEQPQAAMRRFVTWIAERLDNEFGGSTVNRAVFVGYPATYDFMFIYWYLMKFVGHSPFSHSGFDIKTAAAVKLNKPYRQSTKRNLPQHWFAPDAPHTHVAVDDAIEQGLLFCRMMKGSNGNL